MSRRIPLLLGLLGVQALLAVLVLLGSSGTDTARPFLELDGGAVTGVTIGDPDGAVVTVTRTDDGWQIDGLPANGDKIEEVIEALTSSAASWPVATSTSSQERFEVTEQSFQRRLGFEGAEGVLAEVFLGTSPGFRRVHARVAGDEAIYSIDFAVHRVPTGRDDWLDKKLLASESVRRITFPDGQVLSRGEDETWQLDGEPVDEEAADRLATRIEGLSVLGLHDPEGDESAFGEVRTVAVEADSGAYELSFRHDEGEDEYLLGTDRFAESFRVASYLAEQILIEPLELLAEGGAAGDAAAESGPETTAETETDADA